MLDISQSQLDHFSMVLYDRYVERMVLMLKKDFPYSFASFPNAELRGTVRGALQKAKQFKLNKESDLTLFVRCLALLGIRFYDNPKHCWTRNILESGSLSGKEKMDLIHDHIVFLTIHGRM